LYKNPRNWRALEKEIRFKEPYKNFYILELPKKRLQVEKKQNLETLPIYTHDNEIGGQ